MAYLDFHVHIDYYKDFLEKYNEYEKRKIYTLFVTNLPEIYESCRLNFPDSNYVKIALGYNPMLINEYDFNQAKFDMFFDEVDYIGEVGLDYSKQYEKHGDCQKEVFKYIAKKVGTTTKIMSVHSRDAVEDILDILEQEKVKNVVFHWYTGPIEFVDRIVNDGYYFSVNPSMLRNTKGRNIIRAIPQARLLFESDGPFGKFKKDTMGPSNIDAAYNELSGFLGVDDIRKIILENFRELLSRK